MAEDEVIKQTDQTPDEDPGSKELPQPSEEDVIAVDGIKQVWGTTYQPNKRPAK